MPLTASSDPHAPVEWQPGTSEGLALNLAGMVLTVAGLIGFVALYAASHQWSGSFRLELVDLAVMFVAIVVLMVVHEGVHGAVVALFGTRPRFGAQMVAKVLPVLYCTAPGVRYTKTRFLVVALAPFVVLNLLVVAAIAAWPGTGWLVIPAAVHLGGCIGDLWMAVLTARQPAGTHIEDLKSGIRFHRAAAPA